jgi:hypothetical protein
VSVPGNHDEPSTGERANGRHETAQHDIASIALGERVDPMVDEHVRTCVACRRDLDAYRHVAGLARAGKHAADVPAGPPPQVWDRIASELALTDPMAVSPAAAAQPQSAPIRGRVTDQLTAAPSPEAVLRTRHWRRSLVAAAAVVALAGTGVAGWALGHRTSGTAAARSSQAVLAAQPGTSPAARGTAVLHTAAGGYTLSVAADGLPAPRGYYEVWLFNPSINQMVAVGTLGAGARGSFTVPDGIDLGAYHVVDVSAQKYDGNNAHERSVLRGPLAP